MKRKFGFSLAPLKIPSKNEGKATKTTLDGDLLSPISPPPSPFISRQRIDPQLDAQLKAACAAIVSGCPYPPEPELDFKPLAHTKSLHNLQHDDAGPFFTDGDRTARAGQPRPLPMPAKASRAVAGTKSIQDLRRQQRQQQYDPDPNLYRVHAVREGPTQQVFTAVGMREHDSAGLIKERATTSRGPAEESDASLSTTRTGSTEPYAYTFDTATSSAVLTPGRSPKTGSNNRLKDQAQRERSIQEADEQDGEIEMSRQRQTQINQRLGNSASRVARSDQRSLVRSEMADVQNAVMDAANISRKRSPIGVLPEVAGQAGKVPNFSHRRTKSSQSGQKHGAKMSTDGTHFDFSSGSNSIKDLNRALPPLPPVRTRTEHADGGDAEHHLQHTATTTKGSTAEAARPKPFERIDSANPDSYAHRRGMPSHSSKSSNGVLHYPTAPDSCTSDALPEASSKSSLHSHDCPASPTHSNPDRPSLLVPNFSRKISIDVNGAIRGQAIFDIGTCLPPPPPPKPTKGLRKILSKFDLVSPTRERSAPATWMDHFEQSGIKSGVLVERAAGAPMVRY